MWGSGFAQTGANPFGQPSQPAQIGDASNPFKRKASNSPARKRSPKKKRQLCHFFMQNTCAKGEACPFSHDLSDASAGSAVVKGNTSTEKPTFKSKTPCIYFAKGNCTQGDNCKFSHVQVTNERKSPFTLSQASTVSQTESMPVKLQKKNVTGKKGKGALEFGKGSHTSQAKKTGKFNQQLTASRQEHVLSSEEDVLYTDHDLSMQECIDEHQVSSDESEETIDDELQSADDDAIVPGFGNNSEREARLLRFSNVPVPFVSVPLDQPGEDGDSIDTELIGKCESMCLDSEISMRQSTNLLSLFERDASETGYEAIRAKCVKKYSRSEAGKRAETSNELRSPAALGRTLDYLLENIVDQTEHPDVMAFQFLFDRFRAILKDITSQKHDPVLIRVVECICRYHIYSGYEFSTMTSAGFEPKQNLEQIQRCLGLLSRYYDIYRTEGRSSELCPNESEFLGYTLLLSFPSADESNRVILSVSTQSSLIQSKPIRLAYEAYTAYTSNNYVKFFRILHSDSATVLQKCILHRYVQEIREVAIFVLSRSMSKLPVAKITQLLCFESEAASLDFIRSCKITVENGFFNRVKHDIVFPSFRKATLSPNLITLLTSRVPVIASDASFTPSYTSRVPVFTTPQTSTNSLGSLSHSTLPPKMFTVPSQTPPRDHCKPPYTARAPPRADTRHGLTPVTTHILPTTSVSMSPSEEPRLSMTEADHIIACQSMDSLASIIRARFLQLCLHEWISRTNVASEDLKSKIERGRLLKIGVLMESLVLNSKRFFMSHWVKSTNFVTQQKEKSVRNFKIVVFNKFRLITEAHLFKKQEATRIISFYSSNPKLKHTPAPSRTALYREIISHTSTLRRIDVSELVAPILSRRNEGSTYLPFTIGAFIYEDIGHSLSRWLMRLLENPSSTSWVSHGNAVIRPLIPGSLVKGLQGLLLVLQLDGSSPQIQTIANSLIASDYLDTRSAFPVVLVINQCGGIKLTSTELWKLVAPLRKLSFVSDSFICEIPHDSLEGIEDSLKWIAEHCDTFPTDIFSWSIREYLHGHVLKLHQRLKTCQGIRTASYGDEWIDCYNQAILLIKDALCDPNLTSMNWPPSWAPCELPVDWNDLDTMKFNCCLLPPISGLSIWESECPWLENVSVLEDYILSANALGDAASSKLIRRIGQTWASDKRTREEKMIIFLMDLFELASEGVVAVLGRDLVWSKLQPHDFTSPIMPCIPQKVANAHSPFSDVPDQRHSWW